MDFLLEKLSKITSASLTTWREIMDMNKYSSLRSLVICTHSNNAMHGKLHHDKYLQLA